MAAVDLPSLFADLQRRGLEVGLDGQLRASALLAELAARGGAIDDVAFLADHLSPILCRVPAEAAILRAALASSARVGATPNAIGPAGGSRVVVSSIVRYVAGAWSRFKARPLPRLLGLALFAAAWVVLVITAREAEPQDDIRAPATEGLLIEGPQTPAPTSETAAPLAATRLPDAPPIAAVAGPPSSERQAAPAPAPDRAAGLAIESGTLYQAANRFEGAPTLAELWRYWRFETPLVVVSRNAGIAPDTPLPIADHRIAATLLTAMKAGPADLTPAWSDQLAQDVQAAGPGDMQGLLAAMRATGPGVTAFAQASAQSARQPWSIERVGGWARTQWPRLTDGMSDEQLARIAAFRAVERGQPLTVSNPPWEKVAGPAAKREPSGLVGLWAAILAFLGALAAWLRRGLSATAILDRPQSRAGLRLIQLSVGALPSPLRGRDEQMALRRIAAARQEPAGIDLGATARATARNGGLFSQRSQLRYRTPEYVFLIQSRSRTDHVASRAMEIAASLRTTQVQAPAYLFEETPDRVRAGRGEPLEPLAVAAGRHGGKKLVLVADPALLSWGLRTSRDGWAALLREWQGAALMPVAASGSRARSAHVVAHDLQLPMADLSLRGLEAALDEPPNSTLEPAADGPAPIWARIDLEAWDEDDPSGPELDLLARDLLAQLGFHGLRWLRVCAIYPVLNWDITTALGQLLRDHAARPIGTDERLLRLSQLPWMRVGEMPQWMRIWLLKGLDADDLAAAKAFFAKVLEEVEAPGPGDDGQTLLNFALEGGDDPATDKVFVRFVSQHDPDENPYALVAGTRLRRLVGRPVLKELIAPGALMWLAAALAAPLVAFALAVQLQDSSYLWALQLFDFGLLTLGLAGLILCLPSILARREVLLTALSPDPNRISGVARWAGRNRLISDLLDLERSAGEEPLAEASNGAELGAAVRPTTLRDWFVERIFDVEHAYAHAQASDDAAQSPQLRIFFVMVFAVLSFLTLAVASVRATLFSDAASGSGTPVRQPDRADLLDRNGRLLAGSIPYYSLYIDPREVWDLDELRLKLIDALPQLEPARVDHALRGTRRAFVVGGLLPGEYLRIHELGLPGVTFETELRRIYPLGSAGAHYIGFADSGGEGLAGAEAALNDEIRGQQAVRLAMDLRVQAAIEHELLTAVQEFRPRGAVGLVTNVQTGEILALASWPTFDPNHPGKASLDGQFNRPAGAIYEMGSTFKAFTIAAALDAGVADMNSTFDTRTPLVVGYRTVRDYHPTYAVLNLEQVFTHSSNIGAARLGLGLGPNRMETYLQGFGLTSPAKVELIESARPLTPKVWDTDAVVSTALGQGMNVTPLSLARAYGAVLNGGVLRPLTIAPVADGKRPEGKRVISARASAQMLAIMRANVLHGSGVLADVPGVAVGGKTGTGAKFDPALRRYSTVRDVSSFAAVFPTDGPPQAMRYFVLILLDEPQPGRIGYTTGGIVAAPAAGRVIARIAPFLGAQSPGLSVAPQTRVPTAEGQ